MSVHDWFEGYVTAIPNIYSIICLSGCYAQKIKIKISFWLMPMYVCIQLHIAPGARYICMQTHAYAFKGPQWAEWCHTKGTTRMQAQNAHIPTLGYICPSPHAAPKYICRPDTLNGKIGLPELTVPLLDFCSTALEYIFILYMHIYCLHAFTTFTYL
jgi:hypothetical protein